MSILTLAYVWSVVFIVQNDSQFLPPQTGPMVVVAPDVLLTSDPDFMRRMAAPRSKYKRNVWYMAFRFNPEKDHIASYRDNEAHSQLKQKLAPGVSFFFSFSNYM